MVTDILIEPASGDFDVARLEAYLENLPCTRRDPAGSGTFMIAETRREIREAHEARRADSQRFPTNVILVSVSTRSVLIAYRSTYVAPARHFVEWLRELHELRYQDADHGVDITAHCADGAGFLFDKRA